MTVLALHAGVTRDDVQSNTGFALNFADRLETTEPPTREEIEVLRHLDPERRFIG